MPRDKEDGAANSSDGRHQPVRTPWDPDAESNEAFPRRLLRQHIGLAFLKTLLTLCAGLTVFGLSSHRPSS